MSSTATPATENDAAKAKTTMTNKEIRGGEKKLCAGEPVVDWTGRSWAKAGATIDAEVVFSLVVSLTA